MPAPQLCHQREAMAEKQLIVAVEGTAALGPYWQTILSDYLDKIIRFAAFFLEILS